MRFAMVFAAALVVAAGEVDAQPGTIAPYADPGGINCSIIDAAVGALDIYFVHTSAPGASACRFAAPPPPCMAGVTYLSDSSPFGVVIGSAPMGVSIGYGECLSSPIHVLTSQYLASGTSFSCCIINVVPDPLASSGQVEIVDCTNTIQFATGGFGIINGNSTCTCAVANHATTWGRVKSLYAN